MVESVRTHRQRVIYVITATMPITRQNVRRSQGTGGRLHASLLLPTDDVIDDATTAT